MIIDRGKTVCFSGYRPHKFDFPLSNNDTYNKFNAVHINLIMDMIKNGYENFLFGGAPGYDIACAELIKITKKSVEDSIKLICALPYSSFSNSKHFNKEWQDRYNAVIAVCDDIVNATGKDFRTSGCYQVRNRFMIDNSSKLICYHTGKSGGTANTILYAQAQKVTVINSASLIHV